MRLKLLVALEKCKDALIDACVHFSARETESAVRTINMTKGAMTSPMVFNLALLHDRTTAALNIDFRAIICHMGHIVLVEYLFLTTLNRTRNESLVESLPCKWMKPLDLQIEASCWASNERHC